MAICPECDARIPTGRYSFVCYECEVDYEKELTILHARLELARAQYQRSRMLVKDLGCSHSDGIHGLDRAARDYENASILYARAVVDRTRRILGSGPRPDESPI